MRKYVIENIIKNLMILILLIPACISSNNFIISSPIINDRQALGSLLTAVAILAMIACAGNYTFTYEKVNLNNIGSRLLAHTTTGLLMLLLGLSLQMTSVLVNNLSGRFVVFDISLVILYITSILYDFWDLMRENLYSKNNSKKHVVVN